MADRWPERTPRASRPSRPRRVVLPRREALSHSSSPLLTSSSMATLSHRVIVHLPAPGVPFGISPPQAVREEWLRRSTHRNCDPQARKRNGADWLLTAEHYSRRTPDEIHTSPRRRITPAWIIGTTEPSPLYRLVAGPPGSRPGGCQQIPAYRIAILSIAATSRWAAGESGTPGSRLEGRRRPRRATRLGRTARL
jgi:hypothetical protein